MNHQSESGRGLVFCVTINRPVIVQHFKYGLIRMLYWTLFGFKKSHNKVLLFKKKDRRTVKSNGLLVRLLFEFVEEHSCNDDGIVCIRCADAHKSQTLVMLVQKFFKAFVAVEFFYIVELVVIVVFHVF